MCDLIYNCSVNAIPWYRVDHRYCTIGVFFFLFDLILREGWLVLGNTRPAHCPHLDSFPCI